MDEARRREQVDEQPAAVTRQQEEVEDERATRGEPERGDPRRAAGRDREAGELGTATGGSKCGSPGKTEKGILVVY